MLAQSLIRSNHISYTICENLALCTETTIGYHVHLEPLQEFVDLVMRRNLSSVKGSENVDNFFHCKIGDISLKWREAFIVFDSMTLMTRCTKSNPNSVTLLCSHCEFQTTRTSSPRTSQNFHPFIGVVVRVREVWERNLSGTALTLSHLPYIVDLPTLFASKHFKPSESPPRARPSFTNRLHGPSCGLGLQVRMTA